MCIFVVTALFCYDFTFHYALNSFQEKKKAQMYWYVILFLHVTVEIEQLK